MKKTLTMLAIMAGFLMTISFEMEKKIALQNNEQETLIRIFTFRLNSESQFEKFEKFFSSDAKFLLYKYKKSSMEFKIYCKEVDFSLKDFDKLLQEYGLHTKTLMEVVITKDQFYKKHQ